MMPMCQGDPCGESCVASSAQSRSAQPSASSSSSASQRPRASNAISASESIAVGEALGGYGTQNVRGFDVIYRGEFKDASVGDHVAT